MTDKEISEVVVQRVMNMENSELAALSVNKLSRLFDIDRCKLSRQFKRQKEMTLECFIFREKMTRAAFMLMGNPDITVREISERIGFCTSDYFIRKFRKFYGIVPGKFREYRTRRSGKMDRRSGRDRRRKSMLLRSPEAGERRKRARDRRRSSCDRRNQKSNGEDRNVQRKLEREA
jgi:AraC-like DNA-binding protein